MPTRPTTQEQQEDAKRLAKLYREWLSARPSSQPGARTQEEVADQLGVSQSAFSQRLSGRLAINEDFAARIATLIGCTVDDFSPRLAAEIRKLAAALRRSDGDGCRATTPAPANWPLETVSRERWEALTERQKGAAEAALVQAIDAIEARAGNRRSA